LTKRALHSSAVCSFRQNGQPTLPRGCFAISEEACPLLKKLTGVENQTCEVGTHLLTYINVIFKLLPSLLMGCFKKFII
jgi:hypothetical protein